MEYTIEPDIKRPVKNPLASDQVVRTMKITTLFQEYKQEQKDVKCIKESKQKD